MGTNYYLHEKPPCECCGRPYEPLHIGKSSFGWCFSLHVDPAADIHGLPDWINRWSAPGAYILDEYGERVTADVMHQIITERHRIAPMSDDFDWCRNHAQPGPGNLARHAIGHGCIGHGEGTWDLITGEFS